MSRRNNVTPKKPVLQTMFTNNYVYNMYYMRLKNIACNVIKWSVPDTIDTRWLELNLMENGVVVFFYDEIMGEYLCLPCILTNKFNVYNIPTNYTAIAPNGYRYELNQETGVLIFNNYLHTPYTDVIAYYARILTEIEQTMMVNIKAQKTPIMFLCDERTRLSMRQLYMQYDGNEPYAFANDKLDLSNIQVLKTDAPYVAGDLQSLKNQFISDFLNFLGIENIGVNKRERLVKDEANSFAGIVESNRNVLLDSRLDACEKINSLFGLNVTCKFNSQIETIQNTNIEEGVTLE